MTSSPDSKRSQNGSANAATQDGLSWLKFAFFAIATTMGIGFAVFAFAISAISDSVSAMRTELTSIRSDMNANQNATNARFDDMRNHFDRRFDYFDRRFGHVDHRFDQQKDATHQIQDIIGHRNELDQHTANHP